MNKLIKAITITTTLLATGVASAQVIYEQTFDTDSGIVAVADNEGFTPTANPYGTWLHTRAVYDEVSKRLQIRSNTNGGTRGAGFALAATNFSAGTYTLLFDVATVDGFNFPLLGVGVYEMEYGGISDYRLDFVEAAGSYVVARTGGAENIRSTILPEFQISAAGSYSYNIALTGSNDLVILFSGMSALGNEQSVYLDNVRVVVEGTVITPDPTWAGYPIRPDGYVDTTPFLGWIWVGDPMAPSDWIWSVSLSNFVYMPESLVNPESGAWAYVPRF